MADSARGPEGREGQVGREGAPGREGLPGVDGEAGAIGETGAEGERGRTGPLPRSVKFAFIAITGAMALALTGVGVVAKDNRTRADEGREAHDALCVIKANFVLRHDRTQTFLDENPGPLIFGIRREEIVKSLNDTKETLRALKPLVCRPPASPTTTERLP